MAFVYQISFTIDYDHLNHLDIGSELEVALMYLKAMLPAEPGFINSRGLYSINHPDEVHVVFESTWDHWDDLKTHREESYLDEMHLLHQFKPDLTLKDLQYHLYEEIP